MKVRILTSCTGKKQYSPDCQLHRQDFRQLHDSRVFADLEDPLASYRLPAAQMYTGQQHIRLMQGVRHYQEKRGKDKLDLWILSAGYGLIPDNKEIVPYECTFTGMSREKLQQWAQHLRIPQSARSFFATPCDLVIVLLGECYIQALELDDATVFASPTLFVAGQNAKKYIRGKGKTRIVALSRADATRFSCGLVGLKGEVVRRILYCLAEERLSLSTVTSVGGGLRFLVDAFASD